MTQSNNIPRCSLQEIWRKGCQNEPLHSNDHAHFVKLARSRFHTFLLGMQHAEGLTRRSGAPSTQSALLVRGMVSELQESPGLEAEWHDYNFADSSFGQLVTQQLTPRRHWLRRTMNRLTGARIGS